MAITRFSDSSRPTIVIGYHIESFKPRVDHRLIATWWFSSFGADRYIPDLYDLYDLYDLAHVAGWEPYNLHDLGHVSWVGSVLYRSCTTSHIGRLRSKWSRSWSARGVESFDIDRYIEHAFALDPCLASPYFLCWDTETNPPPRYRKTTNSI